MTIEELRCDLETIDRMIEDAKTLEDWAHLMLTNEDDDVIMGPEFIVHTDTIDLHSFLRDLKRQLTAKLNTLETQHMVARRRLRSNHKRNSDE